MGSFAGTIIPTLCGACHNSCGMLATVVDGQIRSVHGNLEHPMNRGTLCAKGACMPELVNSPDRLRRLQSA